MSNEASGAAREGPHGAIELSEQLVRTVNTQAKQVAGSAKNLVAGAGSSFHIEPTAAATLIKSCQDALDELELMGRDVVALAEAPQLGKSPGALVVASFTKDVANDPQGIKPAIENLKSTLNDMMAAYQKASTNYAETETALAQLFKDKS